MADVAVQHVPRKKSRSNGRIALEQKTPSENEANIVSQKLSQASPAAVSSQMETGLDKENLESLSQRRSSPKKFKGTKGKGQQQSFEKQMDEMQERLEKLKIDKDKTDELLKQKEEMLKLKDEELETKGKEQEKLQIEFKKLQKIKEFKPTIAFPIAHSSLEKEQDKDEKKKGGPEKKRPSTPYILWCKDQWNEVKKEYPEAEFKDMSNILGARWKTVSAQEKKPYEEKYQAQKEAYLQVMAKEKREAEAMKLLEDEHRQKTAMALLDQYLQFKHEAEKDKKRPKKERDPEKPKKSMSAFFLFSNQRRAALSEETKNITEIAKITGEEWKNMTEKQRRPYEEAAKKNKEKYLLEMEAYNQKKEEEVMNQKKEEEELIKVQKQEALQLLKEKEKTENLIKKNKEKRQPKKDKNSDPNKAKKPASSFILFSKEARKTLLQEHPGTSNSTVTAMISVKWKELSEEMRNVWIAKAAEAKEAYKKELEEYNKNVEDMVGKANSS